MRPCRVEMEGFSAFRAPTVVDFTDVDLFAFVGPTGAGKSSVIDAMVFALYGSVPRYGKDNLVHPVITQGKPEARVRFDFEVGGVAHCVVRVVRRTKTGATTKEARLERGEEVLAADAKAVSATVVDLLGLDLEQFTKCVVLPQGAFAALLHDTSAKRQDLLVKLLDLGVYEQVAAAARRRVADAERRMATVQGALDAVAGATDDAVAAAAARIVATAEVLAALDAAAEPLAALDASLHGAENTLAGIEAAMTALDAVRVPAAVDSVAARLASSAAAVVEAEAVEAVAQARVVEAVDARAALGDPARLHRLLDAQAESATVANRIEKGTALVAEQASRVDPLTDALARAEAAEAGAETTVARVRLDQAAADLARHLHEGDDCPVCGATVTTLPAVDAAGLVAAEQAHRVARHATAEARTARDGAAETLAGYRAKLAALHEQAGQIADVLDGAPGPDELRAAIDAVAAADAAVVEARNADDTARRAAVAARASRDDATAAEADARRGLVGLRDRLAAHEPPSLGGDLAADWAAMAGWATAEVAALVERRAAAEAERIRARDERRRLVDGLAIAARTAGVRIDDPASLRDACVRAHAEAEAAHERLVADRSRAVGLRTELATVAAERDVHGLLASELGPRRFEAWLLAEALAALVEGASARLEELSSGRYALALDDKQVFEVVDHANADERRMARTLSGGETFLASLALALALAERVSELSPAGSATLEAIFLDEGFGTLDPDTLDVVATAIEELGSQGRMVGVVSHVRELAERVPTRFEVRRGPDTASVERVDR